MSSPKPMRLLLTGFNHFHITADNPSTRVGRKLDGEVLSIDAHRDTEKNGQSTETRAMSIHFAGIRNEYKNIPPLISEWHESGQWDAIVHVGLAASYDGVGIEHRTRRIGYSERSMDNLGEFAPRVSDGFGIEGDVTEWRTKVDYEKVLEAVQAAGFKHTFASPDAGTFICAFTYANSLICADEIAKEHNRKPIPVLFVHNPWPQGQEDHPGPYTLDELSDCLRVICKTVGEQAAKEQFEQAALA